MNSEFDVAIIGGAFSGAAIALLLKRKRPETRVLIIEKATEFDRKVGESTTEVSSCFLTRMLGLTSYLGHHQLTKQGLRLWFSDRPEQAFDDCVEVGARYQTRLPTFQVDRSKLDEHLLNLAAEAGCEIWRPAKVSVCDLGATTQSLTVAVDGEERHLKSRWVVDASGRATFLARKLGLFRANVEHPINAVWARFTGVKDWDSYEWRERFPDYAAACRTSRSWATNHLMGRGWWCWIIPLKGGDHSAGLVYDSRIFKLPDGAHLGEHALQGGWYGHPIHIVGFAQFRQRAAQASHGRLQAQEIVTSPMQSGEGFPEAMIERIVAGQPDIQLLGSSQPVAGPRFCEQVGEPSSRLLLHAGVLDPQVYKPRTVINPAVGRHIRPIKHVASIQVEGLLVRSGRLFGTQ